MQEVDSPVRPEEQTQSVKATRFPRSVGSPLELKAANAEKRRYGWLSLLRSYLILDPLIWLYSLILGPSALVVSLF